MTLSEFITNLVKEKNNNSNISRLVNCAIDEFSDNYDFNTITTQIENIEKEDFTDFGDKISKCIRVCKDLQEDSVDLSNEPYYIKLNKFASTLVEISEVVLKIGADRKVKKDASDALAQNADVLAEQNRHIQSLRQDIKEANAVIDDKIFSLLINTVAILGIFVAIAFAGFGTMSLLSNINVTASIGSKEAFLKNTYFLTLVAFLSYNLLLLLIYFVFKLSRPLLKDLKRQKGNIDEAQDESIFRFIDTVNLTPFYIINGIIGGVTLILFIFCLFV